LLKTWFKKLPPNYKVKGRYQAALMVIGVLIVVLVYFLFDPYEKPAPSLRGPSFQQAEEFTSKVLPEPEKEIIHGRITKNMTLSEMLISNSFPHELIDQLVSTSKAVYDLRKLRIGNRFELERNADGTLYSFRYNVDSEKYLQILRVDNSFQAQLLPFEYENRVHRVLGTIHSSLFDTIARLEETDQLALNMAEIFSWDIDFNTEIQRGDRFSLVVEKLYLEGDFVKYGNILALLFSNGGNIYNGYYFEDAEGESGYFDDNGQSLKRDFLKSPVKFSRISSRFSRRRFHPILKRRLPHLGVDYAAPRGTPVVAAGNGRIQFKGWRGGFGKFVEIKHRNGFTTMYAHLSRFSAALRRGMKVTQGQVIGYVGSTGLSTGPHLDYRVKRNGVFVNPLTLKMKPSKPLKTKYQEAFQEVKTRWQNELRAIGSPSKHLQRAEIVPTLKPELIY